MENNRKGFIINKKKWLVIRKNSNLKWHLVEAFERDNTPVLYCHSQMRGNVNFEKSSVRNLEGLPGLCETCLKKFQRMESPYASTTELKGIRQYEIYISEKYCTLINVYDRPYWKANELLKEHVPVVVELLAELICGFIDYEHVENETEVIESIRAIAESCLSLRPFYPNVKDVFKIIEFPYDVPLSKINDVLLPFRIQVSE